MGLASLSSRASGKFDQRRKDVDQRNGRRYTAWRDKSGRRDHQGHARRTLEKAHLVPEPSLAQHLAMVAEEQHGRVVEPRGIERIEQPAELCIAERDSTVVSVARITDLLVREVDRIHGADVADPGAMRIERNVTAPYDRHVDHPDADRDPSKAA